jgi:transposase-like protein
MASECGGRRDVAKEQYWREVVERQAASGQSVRAFCAHETLDENAFYSWRRTIRQRDAPAKPNRTPPSFVPALRVSESIAAPRLAELVAALEGRGVR